MTDRPTEQAIAGLPASAGLAIGELALDVGERLRGRLVGNSAEECERLLQAIATAKEELARLIAAEDALAAGILEFQEALLEDDELLAPIFKAIQEGNTAHGAWDTAMDREIAAYQTDEDELLSARADDLADLKQRVLRAISGSAPIESRERAQGAIYVAEDLTPSRFLELDWQALGGAAICGSSRNSHVAILARARGIPLVVGLEAQFDSLPDGITAFLDAEMGRLVLAPSTETLAEARTRMAARRAQDEAAVESLSHDAATATGERVQMMINVDDPAVLDRLSPDHCDGIGLTRTEFLFQGAEPPDEEQQLAVYRRILTWAGGKPVTIRTLDAGGDKPIPGITPESEANPFLGVRGLRLSLARPEVFRVQLRALARAAAHAPLKVMLPMVTLPAELAETRRLLKEILEDLKVAGLACALPALGIMVEVPAAALTAKAFAADFYSIGSNDLVQYTTAAARDNSALEDVAAPDNPAVAELIRRTVKAAEARGVEVSLCGDLASDPEMIPLLLDCGLRCLSVAPAQLARVKQAVGRYQPKETGA